MIDYINLHDKKLNKKDFSYINVLQYNYPKKELISRVDISIGSVAIIDKEVSSF